MVLPIFTMKTTMAEIIAIMIIIYNEDRGSGSQIVIKKKKNTEGRRVDAAVRFVINDTWQRPRRSQRVLYSPMGVWVTTVS